MKLHGGPGNSCQGQEASAWKCVEAGTRFGILTDCQSAGGCEVTCDVSCFLSSFPYPPQTFCGASVVDDNI